MPSEEQFTHFDLAKNSSFFWALLAFLFHMEYASKTGWTFKHQLNPNNHYSVSCLALFKRPICYKPSPHSAAKVTAWRAHLPALPTVPEPEPFWHWSFSFAGVLIWNVVPPAPTRVPKHRSGGGEAASKAISPLESILTSSGLNFQPLELTVSGGCTNFVCN